MRNLGKMIDKIERTFYHEPNERLFPKLPVARRGKPGKRIPEAKTMKKTE